MKEMLQIFFEEKKLPNKECVFRSKEGFVLTDTKMIQSYILECMNETEQTLLWEGLQRCDWENKDLNQVLMNFANGIIQTNPQAFIEFNDSREVS